MPAVPKPKRTKDRELLDAFQGKPCLICKKTNTTVAHHVLTKGAGGPDELWNLMPLCWKHHAVVHQIGLANFATAYKIATAWLESWNWHLYNGKWRPPKR